ncbi:zinc-ribbon domain-containing protein [Chachezhania antarctica]|uniref:zinc-ribbon domain-containing protein n=1 Tax=Chachezhania antarctica TaxID=2340860 RepID=UPI000EAFDAF6|nr:zinc-ribbon domain-containing protein [Chachezhania antarctica]|tara:strand:- start:1272 stop:1985 length:714 start_codon:yes stop_codon:yes gene_type:complete
MRLTCPNCGAQYEIPDDVIPAEGRDVQCSNCEETWFQAHPDSGPTAPAVDLESDDEASEGSPLEEGDWTQVRGDAGARDLDPAITEILQEEARREARLRAAEARAPVESQPELALDSTHAGQRRTSAPRSRRDLLPEIGDGTTTRKDLPPVTPTAPAQEGSSFARGMALAVLIAVGLVLLYANADSITDRLPWAEPALDGYVGGVDAVRGLLGQWYLAIEPTLEAAVRSVRDFLGID